MKKKKQKAIVKESRKLAKKELTAQITGALRTITVNISGNEKKVEKLIVKTAKQLTKKLSGYVKPTVTDIESAPEVPVKKTVNKKSTAKTEETPA